MIALFLIAALLIVTLAGLLLYSCLFEKEGEA